LFTFSSKLTSVIIQQGQSLLVLTGQVNVIKTFVMEGVMGTLKWIQKWYFEQCNGDWEHGYGIRIDTVDNPGWSVMISVEDTDVRDKPFESVNIERTETDWIYCKKLAMNKDRMGCYLLVMVVQKI
jgi:hypothetical protein